MSATEVNFDGLVGPTHNYAGLSFGNQASMRHAQQPSNPKAAAKQGLEKMRFLMELGFEQAVLPPHERPDLGTLARLGFTGSVEQILDKAYKTAPQWLANCFSASAMWTANAVTVSPSADTADQRVHFTPANLQSKFHRTLEVEQTALIFQKIFADNCHFVHHPPLPPHESLGDEGAANHTRFCREYGQAGVHFFVFGRHAGTWTQTAVQRYPARQTFEASCAVARSHLVDSARIVFAQQHPVAIDAGVFHNDVIAVGNRDLLLYHEEAFLDSAATIEQLQQAFGGTLRLACVPRDRVSLTAAVNTYLFNSQLLSRGDGQTILVAPLECQEHDEVCGWLDDWLATGQVAAIHYLDVRESMRNGGGPACLRNRIVLTELEMKKMNNAVRLTPDRYQQLNSWVEKFYRDRLTFDDLRDPQLVVETRQALDELTQVLEMPNLYPFQR